MGTILTAQSLTDYQRLAVENSPSLQSKQKKVEAALQQVHQVGGFPDPTFSFSFSIMPEGNEVMLLPARLSLNQMFPWFGTLKSQRSEAAFMAEAEYQSLLDERNQILSQVAAAYFPLYEVQQMIAIEVDNLALLESYKNIATQKFTSGKSSMVDVLRTDILLQAAKTNLSILRNKRKPLETVFNNILNQSPHDSIVVSELPTHAAWTDAMADTSFTQHPQVKEWELKIKATEASKQAAIKKGLPTFGVGIEYIMRGSRGINGIPPNAPDMFMPMLSMSLPIFRKKYKAAQRQADLLHESYSFLKDDAHNRLRSAYAMLAFEVQQQQDLIYLYEEQMKTTEQALRLLAASYANATIEVEELLRMQQELLQLKKMKVQAVATLHTKVAELQYITAKNNNININ